MSDAVIVIGRDISGNAVPMGFRKEGDGEAAVYYSASADYRNLRGLADDRPAASFVPPGTTYWSVDEPLLTVEVSDGNTWRPVVGYTNIITLTQAEYDALDPDPNTVYMIEAE